MIGHKWPRAGEAVGEPALGLVPSVTGCRPTSAATSRSLQSPGWSRALELLPPLRKGLHLSALQLRTSRGHLLHTHMPITSHRAGSVLGKGPGGQEPARLSPWPPGVWDQNLLLWAYLGQNPCGKGSWGDHGPLPPCLPSQEVAGALA